METPTSKVILPADETFTRHSESTLVESDYGSLMLAWSKLIERVAGGSERVLVLCDDPWLFRHLAGLPNVTSGPVRRCR